jgi:hypothetical protein
VTLWMTYGLALAAHRHGIGVDRHTNARTNSDRAVARLLARPIPESRDLTAGPGTQLPTIPRQRNRYWTRPSATSIRSAASFLRAGMTWLYRFMVRLICEWPSNSITTRAGTC